MGIWTALRIPGVVPFAATLFFCKLVAYTFLFWLPYYLSSARIGTRRLSPQVIVLLLFLRSIPTSTF